MLGGRMRHADSMETTPAAVYSISECVYAVRTPVCVFCMMEQQSSTGRSKHILCTSTTHAREYRQSCRRRGHELPAHRPPVISLEQDCHLPLCLAIVSGCFVRRAHSLLVATVCSRLVLQPFPSSTRVSRPYTARVDRRAIMMLAGRHRPTIGRCATYTATAAAHLHHHGEPQTRN